MVRLRAAALTGVAAACAGMLALAAPAASADSVRSGQGWVLNMLNMPAAWTVAQGQGATVAVLDSGVDSGVSDLAGSVVEGPDFTGVNTPPSSPDWGQHGTWMASIIAGHGHGPGDGSGIIGIAPRSKVLSVRVIPDKNDPGYTRYEHEQESRVQGSLARGIRYAVDHGADVISMSIGYSAPSAAVRSALQYANGHGVVVVASSGNSGGTPFVSRHDYAPLSFPADYPGVIGVAAVSSSGSAAGFSSDNLSVQVAAPGVNVPAQGRDGQYWLVSGTSPACALVAGVAALIKSRYPGLAPDLVARALTSTTQFRPSGGYDQQVGFGTVDAPAALSAAGRLSAVRADRTGAASAEYFGGGPPAVAASPVKPRGSGQLVLFAVLSVTALALLGAAVSRLAVLNRMRRREEAALAASPVMAGAGAWEAAGPGPPVPAGSGVRAVGPFGAAGPGGAFGPAVARGPGAVNGPGMAPRSGMARGPGGPGVVRPGGSGVGSGGSGVARGSDGSDRPGVVNGPGDVSGPGGAGSAGPRVPGAAGSAWSGVPGSVGSAVSGTPGARTGTPSGPSRPSYGPSRPGYGPSRPGYGPSRSPSESARPSSGPPRSLSEPPRASPGSPRASSGPARPSSGPARPFAEPPRPFAEPPRPFAEPPLASSGPPAARPAWAPSGSGPAGPRHARFARDGGSAGLTGHAGSGGPGGLANPGGPDGSGDPRDPRGLAGTAPAGRHGGSVAEPGPAGPGPDLTPPAESARE